MEIYLKDQIVILDEAHNIEDSAREAASCSISQQDIEQAVKDINYMSKNLLYMNFLDKQCWKFGISFFYRGMWECCLRDLT